MRTIDVDALYKDICDSINQMTEIGIAVDGDWLWAKLNDAIDNAPTIEPERKTGKWIRLKNGDAICSECKHVQLCAWSDDGCDNFCHHCGAKMEE